MAYNEKLLKRVHWLLIRHKGLTEKRMFGGVAFMLHGRMCCGIVKDDLVIRVGPGHYREALAHPHARPMDFTGRPLTGFVYVGPGGYGTSRALKGWIQKGVKFVQSLPAKQKVEGG